MVDITAARRIPGWMDRVELRWLARTAQSAPLIVEFGSHQGRSTRALADHCPGTVYAVDPWTGPYYTDGGGLHEIQTAVYDKFADYLADHLASGKVVPIQATSLDAAAVPPLADLRGEVDFVFIDGDHREAAVRCDIALARSLLRPHGTLAGHDYGHPHWPAVRRVVDAVFPSAGHVHSIWWVSCDS